MTGGIPIYGKFTDIYSFGRVFFELVAAVAKLPKHHDTNTWFTDSAFKTKIGPLLAAFIKLLCNTVDYNARPSATEALGLLEEIESHLEDESLDLEATLEKIKTFKHEE